MLGVILKKLFPFDIMLKNFDIQIKQLKILLVIIKNIIKNIYLFQLQKLLC